MSFPKLLPTQDDSTIKRQRFAGSDDVFITALELKTPTDVKYTEDASDSVNHKQLRAQRARLVRLRQLQANLAFKKSQVRSCLKQMRIEFLCGGLRQTLKAEFVKVTTSCVMAMLRHVAQALSRKRPPQRVQDPFEVELAGDALIAVGAVEVAPSSTKSYFFTATRQR